MIDVSIPIELINISILTSLYADGKTTSDPDIMLTLVLGLEDSELAAKLKAVMV